MTSPELSQLQQEIEELRLRLAEAEQALEAIHAGEVDSLIVDGPQGLRVYALEGATNSYRVLVESISEGAVTLTEEGVILYSNGSLARMVDRPLQRIMGSSIYQLVPERLHGALTALLRAARDAESRSELALLRASGKEMPAYLSVNAIEDEGRPILCVVVTDLREQKRNEEILAAERLASSVLEQAAEAIIVCDEKARVIRASDAAIALCGKNPLLMPFEQAFPLEFSAATDGHDTSVAAELLRGRVLRAVPATLSRAGGEAARVLLSAAPLQDEEGRILGCVATMVDVTDHHRAERALHESEERLRLALEGGRQGIWDWDLKSKHLTWDELTKKIFGLGSEAVVSVEQFFELVHPEDRERIVKVFEASASNCAELKEEYRAVRLDGSMRWLETRGRIFCDQNDEPVRLTGTVIDVTDRRLAEEAVREADRRKDEFLAVLSHELRNPLAPITTSLHILEHVGPGTQQAKRAQTIIARQVGQLARLVDDLLDLTRIARNKISLRRESLELNELVKNTVEDYRSLFERNGVRFELELSPDKIFVFGDAARLAQIVGNLLQNAIKFTSPGARTIVSLHGSADDEQAILRVVDEGIGMSPDVLGRLFEPFSQADRTLDRKPGGLGLGLALVKGLVEMHGGQVAAHSAGLDKGAEFLVKLPRHWPLKEGATQRGEPKPSARRRILIIEDNLDAAESLRDALELDEHQVEVVYNGPDGLQKAREYRPELVLCDIGLPDMDGYEVARSFRLDEELRSTYLVALSGYARPEDIAKARQAGFNTHISKPPDLKQLEQVIERVPNRADDKR